MTQSDRASGGQGSVSASQSGDRQSIETRLESERRSLSQAASDAADTAVREGRALGAEAQHATEAQAEKVREAAASHLDSFADALRAASDELGRNQTGPAAEMVSHAASGLETLTRSLHGKSTGEMLDTVRQFGRDNPLGFLAGSVLAGLALGRFASVASAAPARDGRGSRPGTSASTDGQESAR